MVRPPRTGLPFRDRISADLGDEIGVVGEETKELRWLFAGLLFGCHAMNNAFDET